MSDWSVLPLMFMGKGKTMHCRTKFFDTIRPPYLSFRDYEVRTNKIKPRC